MTEAQLNALITVADCRSFTLAATQLNVSQSAISHAIRQLEKTLKVKLLNRKGSDVILTDVGELILRNAREITGLLDGIRQEASNVEGVKTGTLRIGSFGPSASLRLLPQILEAFHEKHPNIEVFIDEGNDQEVSRWLQERRVDIGFVVLPEQNFETIHLATDQMVAVLPKDHLLSDQTSISLSDICDEPFILTGAGSGRIVQSMFAREQLSPRIQYRISQILSTLAYIERSEAVTVMAELSLPEHKEDCAYITLPLNPQHNREVGLAFLSDEQQSPATRAFIKLAKLYSR